MIFREAPENFNPQFEVVSCFVEHNGKFVLLHRHKNKPQGNTWGVVAGKIEEGESPADAILREIREESGLSATSYPPGYFGKVYVRYPEYDFVYHIFSLRLDFHPEIKIKQDEHEDFMWASPETALKMNLIGDLDECIRLFYKQKGRYL